MAYILKFSNSSGCSVSVRRKEADGEIELENEDEIYEGDVLHISVLGYINYDIISFTVNGVEYADGSGLSQNIWDYVVTGDVTVYASAVSTKHTLKSILVGAGSAITVKRGDTVLSKNAVIYNNDILTITVELAHSGYNLDSIKVEGAINTTGNNYKVTDDVYIRSYTSVKSYPLTLTAGTGSTISVIRTKSPLQGASTGALSSDSLIYHSDILSISIGVTDTAKYSLDTHTVNGSTFDSGELTVTGSVDAIASAVVREYSVTFSGDYGCTITVKQGSSIINSGASIPYDSLLTVTFALLTGYQLTRYEVVNGDNTQTKLPPITNTTITISVKGVVNISASSELVAYLLKIITDSGSNVTVHRTKTSMQGAPLEELFTDSVIYRGDTLSIVFSRKKGYIAISNKIGSEDVPDNVSLEVEDDISITALSRCMAHSLGGEDLYVTAIKDGDDFSLYAVAIYTENGWVLCGK